MPGVTSLNASARVKDSGPGPYVGRGRLVTLTASTTIDDSFDDTTVLLNALAGLTVTLPPATGSGARYRFMVSVLATSNSYIIAVNSATDFFVGMIYGERVDSGNATLGFAAVNSGTVATNSDTITLNRTTTGSVSVGEWIEVQDVASATWFVRGLLSATGAAFATPFSAAV
jgi:hypothetical protein